MLLVVFYALNIFKCCDEHQLSSFTTTMMEQLILSLIMLVAITLLSAFTDKYSHHYKQGDHVDL